VYPQIQRGSWIHFAIRKHITAAPLLGFSSVLTGPVGGRLKLSATIDAPLGVSLQWRQRGGFTVNDTTTGQSRRLTVDLADATPSPPPEPHMVSLSDVEPIFIATSLPSYEALGMIYYKQNADKAAVTPNVQQLAQEIAQDRTGIDAARAVHDWVAGNIRYLAVWLDPNSGEVAHTADEILQNRYGDCKDHVVIMQALLSALGIRAEPALVNWDSRMQPLPIWSSAAFNHVMVYLPDFDAYANPTNPFARFGTLDIGLANKLVVIATQTGEVRHTPAGSPSGDQYHLQATIQIQPDGTVKGSNRITVSGRADTNVRQTVGSETSSQALADRILTQTPEGGFGTIRAGNPRNLAAPFAIEGEWASPHGIVMSQPVVPFEVPIGIDLTPYTVFRQYLTPSGTRHYPLLIGAVEASWTYNIDLPDGCSLKTPPPAAFLNNAAGSFSANYEPTGTGMRVTRRLTIAKDVFAPEEYPAVQELLYGMIDSARTMAFMKKQ
jgi:hypothetical protein